MIQQLLKNQTFILFGSSIIGVGLGIIASILNTHFLTPAEYGNYRYVYNIISFFSSLLLFGYFVSGCRLLAVTENPLRKKRINGAMILILTVAIIVLAICIVIFGIIQQFWINSDTTSLIFISLPICAAPLLLNYINTTFQGENRVTGLAYARLLPYLIYLPIGYFWYTNWGATAKTLMLLQNGCALIVLLILIIQLRPKFSGLKPIFKELQKENRQYGFHVYIGSVLAVSLGYISGMTLGWFEPNNVNVGYYTLALTIATPLSLLPAITGTTHFKEFATNNCIQKKIIIHTGLLSALTLIGFIIIIIPLVKWLYSEEYAITGIYACFLAIGMTFHGFGDMFNRFLGSHGRGKEIRNTAVINGSVQILGSIVLVYLWGIYGAIITKIISSTIYFVLMWYYYHKYTVNGR